MEKIILLADDDADDRQLFCDALEEIDPSVVCYCATDGKKVLELLQNKAVEKPQVIFIDINMPGMDGWECLKRLKNSEDNKHIPVVMYSTSSHYREANKALDLGALCFFSKPSNYIVLKNILEVFVTSLHGDMEEAISHFSTIQTKKNIRFPDKNEAS